MNYLKVKISFKDEVIINELNFSRQLTRNCDKHSYQPGDLDTMRSAIDEASKDIESVSGIEGQCRAIELEFGREDGTIIDIVDGNNIQNTKEIINRMCIV